ncbi:MAG: ABC transporter ATP-binding protein [Actinomycetota bacterium]
MRSEGVAASCVGVVKIYWTATGEVHALKGIDALFEEGKVTAVVGPSGSGKSSMLRILAGLDRPTAGAVMVGDAEISALPPRRLYDYRRRNVGYVLQRPTDNLIPYLTVAQQLAHAARIRGLGGGAVVDELLERLGLAARRAHRPHQLSGGEQQRVALAQASIGGPALLLADEPTAELDRASGRAVLETISGLARSGISVVVCTHDPQVVEASDRTFHLRHGALEAESTQDRILSVIDASGRIQLPPHALRMFAARRAVMEIDDDGVRITPP